MSKGKLFMMLLFFVCLGYLAQLAIESPVLFLVAAFLMLIGWSILLLVGLYYKYVR